MPTLALLSNDAQLTETVQAAARSEWSLVKSGIDGLAGLVREPNVALVIFDDQSVPASEHGRAVSEIRDRLSRAAIVYVAGEHDPEKERQARMRGVLYYTAKPLNSADVVLLLRRLYQLQNGNHLAPRPNHR